MDKLCKCGCLTKLVKRSDENNWHFNQRKYVNQSHANSYTQGAKNRKRKTDRIKNESLLSGKSKAINNWLSL